MIVNDRRLFDEDNSIYNSCNSIFFLEPFKIEISFNIVPKYGTEHLTYYPVVIDYIIFKLVP